MRRTTPNCARVAEEQRKLVAALHRLDAVQVAALLEPFATAERSARFRDVYAARLASVTVMMDAPHDPHNGAAVLRTCDAFGVQQLHVIERSESFLASRTVSRGSERWVDVATYAKSSEALAAVAASGHELVATHPEGELLPEDLAAIPRLCLILGNERNGIEAELFAAARRSVRIPMRGLAESLNVSVTAAILLDRATRNRCGDLDPGVRSRLYARALVLSVAHAPEILAARGMKLDL